MDEEKITQNMEQTMGNPPENSSPQVNSSTSEKVDQAIKTLYPNREFTSGEELIETLLDDLLETKQANDQMSESNKKVYQMIESNPVLSDIIEALGQGEPFEIALAKNVDLEALTPLEGEEQYESYRKTVADRNARKAQIAKERESLEANQAQSKIDADEFFAQNNIDETEQAAFVDFFDDILRDMFSGKVSKEALKKMYQAFRYEEAVADAAEQGQVDGRNAAIEVKRQKTTATDGLPEPGTAVVTEETKPKKQIFKIN